VFAGVLVPANLVASRTAVVYPCAASLPRLTGVEAGAGRAREPLGPLGHALRGDPRVQRQALEADVLAEPEVGEPPTAHRLIDPGRANVK
jgi:hypothetical protein